MNKSKKLFSMFMLTVALLFTSVTVTNVYADSSDPQGTVNSKKAPPPPPPPPTSTSSISLQEEFEIFLWLWINGLV